MSTSGTQAETYAETTETKVQVMPLTLSKAELIATFFIDDFARFVHENNINLASVLAISEEYDASNESALEILYSDLSRMLASN